MYRKISLSVAVAGLIVATGPTAAKEYTFSVCGGSAGGLWALLGAAVDTTMKAEFPGSTVTYQTSGGGYANVGLVMSKRCALGLVYNVEGKQALEGKGPFKSKNEKLRLVAYLFDWAPFHWMMNKEFADKHNIKTLADIAKAKPPLRLILQRRGLFLSPLGEAMLEKSGVTLDSVKSWGGSVTFAGSGTYSELMANRRGDLVGNSMFIGHSSITQPARATPMKLIPLPSKVVEEISKEWGTPPWIIKAGSYPWVTEDIATVTTATSVFASADTPAQLTYDVAKALAKHIDKVRGVHAAMRQITPKFLASNPVLPYHEGALKYYKEAGLK